MDPTLIITEGGRSKRHKPVATSRCRRADDVSHQPVDYAALEAQLRREESGLTSESSGPTERRPSTDFTYVPQMASHHSILRVALVGWELIRSPRTQLLRRRKATRSALTAFRKLVAANILGIRFFGIRSYSGLEPPTLGELTVSLENVARFIIISRSPAWLTRASLSKRSIAPPSVRCSTVKCRSLLLLFRLKNDYDLECSHKDKMTFVRFTYDQWRKALEKENLQIAEGRSGESPGRSSKPTPASG